MKKSLVWISPLTISPRTTSIVQRLCLDTEIQITRLADIKELFFQLSDPEFIVDHVVLDLEYFHALANQCSCTVQDIISTIKCIAAIHPVFIDSYHSSNRQISITALVIGMDIFESFMTLTQGDAVVSMPDSYDLNAGKHAVAIVGYDLSKQQFLAKNSFGTSWGDMGYFWIPFSYITTYMYECWCFDISDQSGAQLG